MKYHFSLAVLASGLVCGSASAQLFSTLVGTGFTQPVYATSAPGDTSRMWVVQKSGQIRALNTSNGVIGPTLLNLTGDTTANLLYNAGTEQGLLGLAFHPNFQTNGYYFVSYTTTDGGGAAGGNRIERFQVNPTTLAFVGRQTVIQVPDFATNHNGGWLGFSPTDGMLYASFGDGGGSYDPNNTGQNRNTILGKMLRLDVTSNTSVPYVIPSNNPFVGQSNVREEIWAYGLRNPWRNSFDRANGNLWIADVGQGQREEINFQLSSFTGGANYGWRLREGKIATDGGVGGAPPAGNVDPIVDIAHATGNRSITGGYVYRGNELLDGGQLLNGTYFFGDYVSGRVYSFRYDGVNTPTLVDRTTEMNIIRDFNGNGVPGVTVRNVSSFGEDNFGNLYFIDFSDGEIFRINGATVPEPVTLCLFGAGIMGAGYWFFRRYQRRQLNGLVEAGE